MKHFLLTRFNVKASTKTISVSQSDSWLSHRFELFEKYCLPSVKNQFNQNFTWGVFFDTDTPQKYKDKIDKISNSYNNFVPIFINESSDLEPTSSKFIASKIEDSDQYIITTRLDNDDIIHKQFIDTIQKLFSPTNGMVIDLRKGYQITIEKNNLEIRKYYQLFNSFISLIEDSTNFNTVMSRRHSHWWDSKSVVVFDDKRLWIELVHSKNKLNRVKGEFLLVPKIQSNDFGLLLDLKTDLTLLTILFNNLKMRPKYFLRACKIVLERLSTSKFKSFLAPSWIDNRY